MKRRRLLVSALAFSLLGCTAPKRSEAERSPAPTPPARTSEGLVSVEFVPQYDLFYVPAGSLASQQLNVLIRLSGAKDPGATRPDLDLAIVLDRSGSMAGDKLRYAKQAGIDLLAQLGPRDRVTLISYDSEVVTEALARAADPAGVSELRQTLLGLSAGLSTALGPALFEALNALEQQDHRGRLAHVLLLSDGIANEGEQRPPVIAARVADGYSRGITVSTLGVGADYNEDLLTLIADQGGGRYHFIEDAPQIPTVLGDEFAGLSSAVAADLAVEFVANVPISMPAVHGYVSETKAQRTSIRVGYLSSGQSREIVAQLAIPNAMLYGQPGETVELGTIFVRYRPVDSAAGADAPIVELKLPATVTLASSAEQVPWSERTEVTVRVAELETAASLLAASQAIDRGDFAGAERVFEEAEHSLKARLDSATDHAERQKLQAEQAELEEAQSSLKAAKQSGEKRKLVVKKYKDKSHIRLKGSTESSL